MKRSRRAKPRPLPTATRGLVAELAYIIRSWQEPPPELLALLDGALSIIAVAGSQHGPPMENGRKAVEVLVAVRNGETDAAPAMEALKSLGRPSPRSG